MTQKTVAALHAQGGDAAVARWKQETAQLVSEARTHLEIAQLKLYAAGEIEKAEELHLTTDVCGATASMIQQANAAASRMQ